MLRGIGNIGSPWVGPGVCLQVVADRAASKHLGDFCNLGKSGPCADHTGRRTVDDTAVPEFGEWEVRGDARAETRFHFLRVSTSVLPSLVVCHRK